MSTTGYAASIEDSNIDGIVNRARGAHVAIAALAISERLEHLHQLRKAIERRSEEILDRVQADTGKSRSDILMSELFGAMDAIRWLESNAAKALQDSKVETPMTLMGKASKVWYAPRGVIMIISPWNYPFFQAIVPIAHALAAGNAVVYKPSEHTPLTGLIESLLEDAAIAPTWVQVAYGDGTVGAAIIDQRPDQIMFTGSTGTGRKIMAQAAQYLIPVELELGGKDPMIVFDDVNIARTAAGAAFGALTASGQSCTSVERLYVHSSIFAEFTTELVSLVRGLRLVTPGEDRDGDGEIGLMITDAQVDIVAAHVKDAVARGARLLTGSDWDCENPTRAIPPMVIVDLPDDALMATEETFGPVVPVFSFDTEQEVIRRANDSDFGLTASVWSADDTRAERVARALRVGGVSINNVMATEANPALPFGGVGNSGMGRYKGVEGLRGFTNAVSVIVDSDGKKLEANWYPYDATKYALFKRFASAWFADGPARLPRFAALGPKLEGYAQKAGKKLRTRSR